jgi:hypothetical protein
MRAPQGERGHRPALSLRITLVKKIKADGSPCRKCAEVVDRLERSQLLARIDRVVVADERDPDSEGMQLAGKYNVDWAPFFIVEDDVGGERIYTSFFRFLKEVLGQHPRQEEETTEMMRQNRDLDFL